MDISMFGMLSIRDGDRVVQGRAIGGAKPRGPLEQLLLARGRSVTKDALADAVWSDGIVAPRDPFRTLEHYICVLRQRLCTDPALARAVLVTGSHSYCLDTQHVTIDVDRFDELRTRAAEHADPLLRRELLTDAIAIAHSELLEGSPYPAWVAVERTSYRDRTAHAHLWLAGDSILDGDMYTALRHCEEALRCAPLCERAFRLSMVANYALGADDMARAVFQRCRVTLHEGLGLDPSYETQAVAIAIDAGASITEVVAMARGALVYVAQASERRQQRGHEARAGHHRVDEHVLVVGVRAAADRAQAVERGDADRGGEVAVAATADGHPVDAADADRGRRLRRQREQRRRTPTRHRRPVEAAADLDPWRRRPTWCSAAHQRLEALGLARLARRARRRVTRVSAGTTLSAVPATGDGGRDRGAGGRVAERR